jgi:hypothetical protein
MTSGQAIWVASEAALVPLRRVWAEMDYRIDACRATNGANIQHLRGVKKKLGDVLLASVCRMFQSAPPFKHTDFMNCVRELRITLYIILHSVSLWRAPEHSKVYCAESL